MAIILSILVSCIVLTVLVFLFLSPGKSLAFLDENGDVIPGSISEKIRVNINGVEQGMFIKGLDQTKPILLFLHGGPGMPEYAISREYPMVLEKHFTVCWWEQRGAGLSYSKDVTLETMTFEQLIADVLEVTNYLCKRFDQQKIYLMAHSGGSFIGIQAVNKAPWLFHAYIAMSQITHQLESEKLAYHYMIEKFKLSGDHRMLEKFQQFSPEHLNTSSYYTMRDVPMHKLGIGTTRKMESVIRGVFWPVMFNEEYTLKEKINIWRGKYFNTTTAGLWTKLCEEDLTSKIGKLDIPVYFLHGKYDYTTSYDLAKEYFIQLQSPQKGFYTFNESAHSPLFEEPERMHRILQQDVLGGMLTLADQTEVISTELQ